jgi:hypothetical protein
MLSSNTLPLNLILPIDVTFSTPTGVYTHDRIAGEIANHPPGQQLPGEHSSPEAGSQHCPLVGTVCAMEKLRSAPLARTSIEEHATEAKTEYRTEQCCGEHGAG